MSVGPEGVAADRPGIPRVSPDTLESAIGTMREGAVEFYLAAGEQLLREQPHLNAHLLRYIRNSAETDNEYFKMTEIALFLYDVLARQADANAMNRDFGAPSAE